MKQRRLTLFVLRFRRFAAERLMRAYSKRSLQTGEVMAILLFKNSNFFTSTLQNAKLRFIGTAEGLSRNEEKEKLKISLYLEEGKKIDSSVRTTASCLPIDRYSKEGLTKKDFNKKISLSILPSSKNLI